MPDTEHPEIPAAITDSAQAAAMEPPTGEEAVRKMTHEVDTDDMFAPGGE